MHESYIGQKMLDIHNQMCVEFPDLCRIAIAVYDSETDELKTFGSSNTNDHSLQQYSAKLSDVVSLKTLAEERQVRVINDLESISDSRSAHTQWLIDSGFKSSYTIPLFSGDKLNGFLFFDSEKKDYFSDSVTTNLAVYAELINSTLVREIAPIKTLRTALNTASQFAQEDKHSGHLFRIARYAHLLAKKVSAEKDIPDDFAEFVLQYAPLLDIGKIGIPKSILSKSTRLNTVEFETVKEHVTIGLRVVGSIISEFELEAVGQLDILRNIIGTHHEKYDGSGYPKGLKGDEIPLEGRIAAVADVMDALTSDRPHRPARGFDESIDYIMKNTGSHFDPLCVRVLDLYQDEFRAIHEHYAAEKTVS